MFYLILLEMIAFLHVEGGQNSYGDEIILPKKISTKVCPYGFHKYSTSDGTEKCARNPLELEQKLLSNKFGAMRKPLKNPWKMDQVMKKSRYSTWEKKSAKMSIKPAFGSPKSKKMVQNVGKPNRSTATFGRVRATTEKTNCSTNEIFSQCGNSCEPTCFYHDPSCSLPCSTPSCVCMTGFLRDPTRNLCVQRYECPQIDPPIFHVDPCLQADCPPGTKCLIREARCSHPPCQTVPVCMALECEPKNKSPKELLRKMKKV